jgi:hypothetical protein
MNDREMTAEVREKSMGFEDRGLDLLPPFHSDYRSCVPPLAVYE